MNFKIAKPRKHVATLEGISILIAKQSKNSSNENIIVRVSADSMDKYRLRTGDRFYLGYDAEENTIGLIPNIDGYTLSNNNKKSKQPSVSHLLVVAKTEDFAVLKLGDKFTLKNLRKDKDSGIIMGELF